LVVRQHGKQQLYKRVCRSVTLRISIYLSIYLSIKSLQNLRCLQVADVYFLETHWVEAHTKKLLLTIPITIYTNTNKTPQGARSNLALKGFSATLAFYFEYINFAVLMLNVLCKAH
jgi:hypothetical protein